jgi:DNA processing protein
MSDPFRMAGLRHLLRLSSVPGVGPMRIRSLVGRFGSAEAVFHAGLEELRRTDGIDEKTARSILNGGDDAFAAEQIHLSEKTGIRALTFWDDDYPEPLKAIADPPAILFVKGTLIEQDRIAVAVVGTRSPSTYGRNTAERISEELAHCGVTVVSGMARGIDTAAHRGALRGAGRTLAVLGSGADVVYPSENKKLCEAVAESGAVVSEFPLGTQPDPGYFPRRNRIISGLSRGTLVVEAGDRSGALITAYMALDQGRDVFAVPGNITSPKSKGTNRLIREGAKLVDSVEDILAEIPEKRLPAGRREPVGRATDSLNAHEAQLIELLDEEPKHIDWIAAAGNVTTSEALAVLLSLELKNYVKQMTGMRFVRSNP